MNVFNAKKSAPNPWLNAAAEFGKLNDSFVALNPRTNPKSWEAWRNYFRWLDWVPYWFIEVERLHESNPESAASWTAPIDHPDKFTDRFAPAKNPLAPRFPLEHVKVAQEMRCSLNGLRARHGPNWGLKTVNEAINSKLVEEQQRRSKEQTERQVLAEYQRLGIEPRYAGDMLISPSLFESLGRKPAREAAP
jgi:hypothetical protein